jgi:mRNA interferase YafQ
MYEIVFMRGANRSLKKLKRSGSFKHKTLRKLLLDLADGGPLASRYKDHQLKGDLSDYRECHLGFDLLVQYRRDDELKIVAIADIGTHSELFGD